MEIGGNYMAKIIQEINLEVAKPNLFQAIVAKQNDYGSRFLKVTFVNNGEKINIDATLTATINAERPDGASKRFGAVVNNDGTVTAPLTGWMLELQGLVSCDISVITSDGKLTTTDFSINVNEAACSDGDISDDDNYNILNVLTKYNPASINKHYSGFIAGTVSASGVITEAYNGGSTQYFIKQYLEAGTYLYRTNYNAAGVASRRCYRYDENGAYLGSIVCEVVTELGSGREIDKFTLPEGRIIALCVGYINDTDDFMVIEGSTAEDWSNEYVSYYPEETTIADDINFSNSMKADNDILWGKSIAVEGDSICAGNNIVGGYSRWLQYEHNMTVFNTAVGGSPITNVSGKPHIISEAIANMQAGCDYYIFNGGYNDRALNVTVGELVDGFPLKDTDNDTITTDTLAGAMEYACRDLVTIHNGAKCGFIFCHNRYSLNDDYNTKYKAIMKSACEKWGVPYLDLQEQVPPFAMIQSLADKYTQSQDGTHPNWEGYEKYYVPKIVAWLKTL
jgi:hypothetical protein